MTNSNDEDGVKEERNNITLPGNPSSIDIRNAPKVIRLNRFIKVITLVYY